MREWKGLGATCWRFFCKTQEEPAKCVYCVRLPCTVYSFPPCGLKLVQDWPVISVSTWQQLRLGQIVWFGWLSAISQVASRVGQGGGVGRICLHDFTQPYTTWPRWREQGAVQGVAFPPLVNSYCRSIFWTLQDNGKKAELEREAENRESSLEAEDRDKKIISSEEEAKARIAEKRREMKVMKKRKSGFRIRISLMRIRIQISSTNLIVTFLGNFLK